MRSELRILLHVLVCGMLFLSGCTVELPIEPVTTTDDDWTPDFQVRWHGYQRVQVSVDGPPRKELLPNIERYVLEVVKLGDSIYVPVDTTFYFAPSYVAPANVNSSNNWITDPRLEYGTGYYPRIAVHYRTGTIRRNGGSYFRTDAGRGAVVSRLSLPLIQVGQFYNLDSRLTSWGPKLIFNAYELLYSIDTTTGSIQFLTTLLPHLTWASYENARYEFSLMAMGVDGDTLIAAMYRSSSDQLQLHKVNLTTLTADSSISIAMAATDWINQAAVSGSRLALLVNQADRRQRIAIYDTRTGSMIQSYPAGILSEIGTFLYDGTNCWFAQPRHDDFPSSNTIIRFDPNTLAMSEVHRNPVFNYNELCWDPPYVWVEDTDSHAYVKVRLEGF